MRRERQRQRRGVGVGGLRPEARRLEEIIEVALGEGAAAGGALDGELTFTATVADERRELWGIELLIPARRND
jgi:hypothetical protein